jgi:hypothetical protein
MDIKVVTDFSQVDSPVIWAYVYDQDGSLADPTNSITIDIYDPDGNHDVDGIAMTKSSTGIYYYYHHKGASEDPMDKGKWRGVVTTVDGTGDNALTSTCNFSFKVK